VCIHQDAIQDLHTIAACFLVHSKASLHFNSPGNSRVFHGSLKRLDSMPHSGRDQWKIHNHYKRMSFLIISSHHALIRISNRSC